MAPPSMMLALLASSASLTQAFAQASLPTDAALLSACGAGVFHEQDDEQCALSLLQTHTERTRRSGPTSTQKALAAPSAKPSDEASAASLSLSRMRSSIARLAALNDQEAEPSEMGRRPTSSDDVDALVVEIRHQIDDAARLVAAKVGPAGRAPDTAVEQSRAMLAKVDNPDIFDTTRSNAVGAVGRMAVEAEARIAELANHAASAGPRGNEELVRAVEELGAAFPKLQAALGRAEAEIQVEAAELQAITADTSEAIRAQQEMWKPNTDSDPRSKWADGAEVPGTDTRYSRLNPENGGAPEKPESYKALGADAGGRTHSHKHKDHAEAGKEAAEHAQRDTSHDLFVPSAAREQSDETAKPSKKHESAADKFKEAFELFDADDSSSVNLEELNTAMQTLGFNPERPQLEKMLVDIDADRSGAIDYAEFSRMMLDYHLMGSA